MLVSHLFSGNALLEDIAADRNGARISTAQNAQDPAVVLVQQVLLKWDPACLPVAGADGIFGPESAEAVRRFKVEELGVDPASVIRDVGPRTVIRLDEIQAAAEEPPPEPADDAPFATQIVVKMVDSADLALPSDIAIGFAQLAAQIDPVAGAAVAETAADAAELVVRRVFSTIGDDELAEMVAAAQEDDPEYVAPRFQNYLTFACPDELDADALVEVLQQWALVEFAYVQGEPSDPVTGTTNALFSQQGYLEPAPKGIGVAAAWAAGADGSGTSFIDLEQGWLLTHEDLPSVALLSGTNKASSRPHGCAVLGVVTAVDDQRGVAGIAPATLARVISYARTPDVANNAKKNVANMATTIADAAHALGFGGVLLLEVQIAGKVGKKQTLLPVEADRACFDAIRLATGFGVVVVEAAGNGGNDLKDFVDQDGKHVLAPAEFPAEAKRSGAIVVGACTSAVPHKVSKFSNRGSRIDCFAWGDGIVTTGDPAQPAKKDGYWVKRKFGGTSGASPIVVGIILLLQHLRTLKATKDGTSGKAGPSRLRAILSDPANGTSVDGATQPMPDLAKLLQNQFV